MPEQHPPHDETVRMRADGRSEHQQPEPSAPAPADPAAGGADDTRPVTRDWLLGAPDAESRDAARTDQDARTETGSTAPSSEAAPQRTTKAIDVEPADLGATATGGLPTPDAAASPTGAAPASPPAEDHTDVTSVIPPVTDPVPDGHSGGSSPIVQEPAAGAQVAPATQVSAGHGRDDTAAEQPTVDHTTLAEHFARPHGDGPVPPPPPTGGSTGDPHDGGPRSPWWRRRSLIAALGALLLLGVLYGVDLLLSSDSIPRSTVVAGVELGGLTPAAAASTLEEQLAPRVVSDHRVIADDVEGILSPATAGITLDVDATVDAAARQPLNPWTRLVSFFADRDVAPVITGEETALAAQIDAFATQVDRAPVNATVVLEGTSPSLVEPVDGRMVDREGAAEAITAALASGGDPETAIELPVVVDPVLTDTAEAQRVLDETVGPALSAPVQIVSQDDGPTATIPVTAIAASLTFTPQQDGVLAVAVDPTRLQTELGSELSVFGTPAQDASFELSGGAITVVPSVDGTGIAPAVLAERLLPVLTEPAPRSLVAELGPVQAEFTTQAAQALGIVEEISSFTTNIGNAASGENIRVVAAEVDGALVLPGETFSLNGFTGPRGTAQGYVEAGVINNGEFTTAVGGGISQFATTMFNAVFFAGLEDVFHKPHSYYISRYPAGREATVYYDSIDLSWRNDSDHGVYIDTRWTPGTITVTFYGTKRYEVESISSDRYNQRSPVVQEKPDDGSCRSQAGSTGFNITVTRVFKDPVTGQEARPREEFQTRYAAEPIIRCVPVPAPPAAPEGSTPPPAATPGGRRPGIRRAG